eukprot:1721347-Prymnesium_polylepis.1
MALLQAVVRAQRDDVWPASARRVRRLAHARLSGDGRAGRMRVLQQGLQRAARGRTLRLHTLP